MVKTALYGNNLFFEQANSEKIINGISILIKEGSRFVIIGPNGAGKSTLVNLLAGILQPKSGCVFLYGRMMSSLHHYERAQLIAIVGQNDHPDHRLRVWDYVALGRIPYRIHHSSLEEKVIIKNTLHITSLLDFADREIGSLSCGEQQRVQIARALVQQPRILFLDEPTNHLDPQIQSAILTLIAKLGITIVIVLHDLHLVAEFATDVAILKSGQLILCGTVDKVLDPSVIREVFGIDLVYIPHPHENRLIPFFDTHLNLGL